MLVHGAFHGGWCWRDVAALLRGAGHNVFTPTLSGMGERSHLLGPAIGLSTHIADIANLLVWEDLRDVMLCGHSYGGLVVTSVADRMPERVASLVVLDGLIAEDGRCGAEVGGRWPSGEGIDTAPPPAHLFIHDAAKRLWASTRLTPQPYGCSMEKAVISGRYNDVADRRYLHVGIDYPPFQRIAARAKADGWRVLEVAGSHDLMIDDPAATAALLLDAANAA